MKNLDPRPTRRDFTDRECANIIGGILGSLATVAGPKTVRRAVQWWADNDQVWGMMRQQYDQMKAAGIIPMEPPL